MPTFQRADHVINSFLADAEATQEKIVTRAMPTPDDDAETRILKRFTRDMQLIVIQAATDMAKLPTTDSIGKAVVMLSKCMLQGVAAIASPIISEDTDLVEDYVRYFLHEMTRQIERTNEETDE